MDRERQPPDLNSTMLQMMRLWQDMARMWMGSMVPFSSPFAPAHDDAGTSPDRERDRERPMARQDIEVEAAAGQKAHVSVHIQSLDPGARLSAQLDQVGGTATLKDVRVEVNDGLSVHVRIADGMPNGTYWGSIVDDRGRECGVIKVRLG